MMPTAIRVLYVDDEPSLLDIGKLFLEQSGDFTVTTAVSAKEAIRLLEQEKFDTIISDYQMPEMDGIQFLVEMRKRFGQIPFILFTGKGREEVVIQAINNGADFYLQKGGEPGAQFAELTHKVKSAALRNRAEDALRKSEEKYRHLIEHSNEAIVVVQDGMLRLVNHRAVEFTGYTEQELLSMPFSSFIHPDDRAMVVERYQRRLKGERLPSHYRFQLSPKDESTCWVEINVVSIDWDGRPATLNYLTNITERKQAEEALRLSEEKFRKAFFTSPDSICITRLHDGMFVSVNKGFIEMTGYTEEDIAGKTSLEINIWKDPEDRRKIIEGLQANGEVRNYEARFLTKSGEIYGSMSTSIIELNGVPHILNITHDITERKRAEDALLKNAEELHAAYEELTATDEELRQNIDVLGMSKRVLGESEGLLKTVVTNLHGIVFSFDKEGILLLSEGKSLSSLGLKPGQIVGQSVFDVYKDTPELIAGMRTALSGKPWSGISHVQDIFFDTFVTPVFDSSQRVTGAAGIATDITERKRAEQELVSTHESLKEAHRLANIGTWDWVIETDTVTWSDELCSISGWDPSQPAPTYAELPRCYTPSSWDLLKDAVTRALTTGEPYNLELEMIRPDCSIRWTNAFGGVKCDGSGNVIGLHGTVQDITERKRTEAALTESFVVFKTVMDSLDALVYVADMETYEILFINQYGRKIFGDLTGKICWKSLQVDQKGPCPFCTNIKLLDLDGNPAGILIWGFRNTITGQWYECHDSAIRWTDGRIVRIEIASDITDRKRVEEVLHESEEKFRQLFSRMPSAVAIYDAVDGGQDFIIKDLNIAAEKIERISKDEVIGKRVTQVFPGVEDFGIFAVFQRVWRTGQPEYFPSARYSDDRDPGTWRESWVYKLETGEVVAIYHDITERKRAEEALRESESFNRVLVENLPEYVIVYGQDGKILYVNPALVRALGYNAEELVGTSVLSYVAPECRDIVTSKMIARREGDNPPAYEVDIVIHDGLRRSVIVKGTPIHYHDSPAILLLLIDITERKRDEELFQTVFENMGTALIIIEEDTTISHVNAEMETIWGYCREEIEGRMKWPELVAQEDLPKMLKFHSLRRIDPDSAPGHYEFRFIHKNGGLRDAALIAAMIPGTKKSVISLRDITELKKIEKALHESEERYRSVVEDQTEFICRFLPDSTHIFVNDAYCRYFNKKPEEIIGHQFRPLLYSEDREIVARHLASINPEHPVMDIDQRIIMPDYSIRWQRWSDRAIFDENGRVVEYQSVGRDITEQKELEKEMEYHEQELRKFSTSLATANKKLTLLSSITPHDINNQLTILRGYLSILEKKQSDPSLNKYFGKVSTAAKQISAMIQFTKEYEDIGINAPVWQECRTLVDTAAKQAPLGKVIVKNDLPASAEVFADPLIAKVFYNLMDNAVRYGGKITTIRFFILEDSDLQVMVCEDDGDGIHAEEKEKIFERGFGKNTGLGLALAREILDITGITIHETGEPEVGARFEMKVPKGCYRLSPGS
jgi:PAS domain S-box-containing protein